MKEKSLLQLLYLKDDNDQGVEVEEVRKLNPEKILYRLNKGESIFISRKCKPKKRLAPSRRGLDALGTHPPN